MFKYKQIVDVLGRSILDGRGYPSVEVEVLGEDGETGTASVSMELPKEQRDEITESMVLFINTAIADMIIGENLLAQRHIDQILERAAGKNTEILVRKNAIRAVSHAVARTAADSLGIALYQYLGGIPSSIVPIIRICLTEGESEENYRKFAEKWKEQYTNMEFCRESSDTGQNENIMLSNQYTTVTQCLSEIRRWKKEGKKKLIIKDTEYAIDSFLVDLAVAAEAEILQLRTPKRGENTIKYSRLMGILEHL